MSNYEYDDPTKVQPTATAPDEPGPEVLNPAIFPAHTSATEAKPKGKASKKAAASKDEGEIEDDAGSS